MSKRGNELLDNVTYWKVIGSDTNGLVAIPKDEIELHIKNGADLKISLETGNYNEILPIHSVSIQERTISGLVDHHLALPFDRVMYNVLLTYTLDNRFVILRIPHLTGERARYIPNIGFHQNGHYRSYKWFANDRWERTQCNVDELLDEGGEIKFKLTCNDMSFFVRKSIFIKYHNGDYSIRTRLISIPYDDHLDIVNFNITSTQLQQKIYRFYKYPERFSLAWMQQKIKKVLGKTLFETFYTTYNMDEFTVEIYKPKKSED